MSITHEAFLSNVKDHLLSLSCLSGEEKDIINRTKVLYGAGSPTVRGWCAPNAWKKTDDHLLIEISALAEESPFQLAGTLIHEYAHALRPAEGHKMKWKKAANHLGLRGVRAAGQVYHPICFEYHLRSFVASLGSFIDGMPAKSYGVQSATKITGRCSQGIGIRGGKSRGTGSGSRLIKYACQCEPPVIVRHAGNRLHAICQDCQSLFNQ